MSLIGHYKLDGNADDSSGYGNHGTTATNTWTTGKIGEAALFDTTTDYIEIPHNELMSTRVFGTSTTFSFSVWFYPTAWVSYGTIVAKATAGSWSNTTAGIWTYSAGIRFIIGSNEDANPSGSIAYVDYQPTLNAWHHIVGVADGTNISLYVDNVLRGTSLVANVTRPRSENTANITMGRRHSSNTVDNANGYIDDLRIYDHALSRKEVDELSKAKILHYKFDDFQEPTENLYKKTDFLIGGTAPYSIYSSGGTTVGGYIDPFGGNNAVKFTSGGYNLRYGAIDGTNPDMPTGYEYTFSFYAKLVPGAAALTAASADIVDRGTLNLLPALTEYWKRFELTALHDNNANYAFADIFVNSGGEIMLSHPQIEQKDHSTPFVDGSRSGTVHDSSGYLHNASLALATSPKWTQEAKIGRGAYHLKNGQIINSGQHLTYQSHTITFWMYSNDNSTADYQQIMGNGTGATITGRSPAIWIMNASSNTLHWRLSTDLDGNDGVNTSWSWTPGHWVFYAGTWNASDSSFTVYSASPSLNRGFQVDTSTTVAGVLQHDAGTFKLQSESAANIILDDVRVYASHLTETQIKEIFQQRGNADSVGNLSTNSIIETKHQSLILDYTIWEDGGTGGITGFSRNGDIAENYRVLGIDPWGKETVVWEARPDAVSGADGGWNTSGFTVDPTKLYRFSTWVNRQVMGADGRFYLGCRGSSVANLSDGTTNTNPYFWYSNSPPNSQLPEGEWCLVVGHIHPHTYTGTTKHGDSAIYTTANGKIGDIFYDFKWVAGNTLGQHRSYLYYSTDTGVRQQWVYPRVDLVDGTEPSLEELLSGHDSRSVDYIRKKGGTKTVSLDVGSKTTSLGVISEVGPTNGLVGWWPFIGNVEDISGSNNTGTLTGTSSVLGPNGKPAYNFLASGDVVGISEVGSYDVMTLCSWHKWDSTSTTWRTVFAHTSANIHHLIFNNAGYVAIFDGVTQNFGYYYPDTNWHHYCVVIESGTSAKLYVDGVHQADVTTTLDLTTHPIGKIGNWGGNSYPVGGLQDIRIYNRGLTAQEISVLYKISSPNSQQRVINTKNGIIYLKGSLKEV